VLDERERVGYWAGPYAPAGLPDPREHVDLDWPLRERVRVAKYLRRGEVVVAYLGFSHCRFDCGLEGMAMGTRDLGDDRYVWPEGLHHYVEVHAVRLPAAFLEHIGPRLPRLWPWWRVGVWWRRNKLARAIARAKAAERDRVAREEREALHRAAQEGDVARVRQLLAAGRAVDQRDDYGMTALALTRSFEVAQVLVEAGAAIDPRPPGHSTPLQQAVIAVNFDWCRYLLERGADINAPDKFDRTVLSYCKPAMLRFLLDAGADVRIGQPVCNAVGYGDIEMIATLLDAGAEIDGNGSNTALLIAAGSHTGDAALAYLLERGADPTRTDEAGHSALMHAASRHSLVAARLLVEHGGGLLAPPGKVRGRVNALHMAAIGNRGRHDSPEVLEYLLRLPEARAQLDVRDDWGRTPLCCAATYGTADDVRVLLEAGANPKIANHEGHTPLGIARARGIEAMIALLDC
jgi:ankyrin repeat protein